MKLEVMCMTCEGEGCNDCSFDGVVEVDGTEEFAEYQRAKRELDDPDADRRERQIYEADIRRDEIKDRELTS